MADLPDWLRIPEGFASTGDPVDSNPFQNGDPRHQVWRDATTQAEEEWARVNSQWMSALSPDNVFEWYPSLHAVRFSVWAKRGVHVVWTDSAVAQYDDWLIRYANSTLKDLADFFERRPPPFSRDRVLVATRNAIGERVQYWKAEARRYRAEQEMEKRRRRSRAATSEFWRDLRTEFLRLPDLSVDTHYGLLGDERSRAQFKALARRGGVALGHALEEGFRTWLVELAAHLRESRSDWLHPNRVRPQDLISLGNDDYVQHGTDGGVVLEGDVWIEHVSQASAGFCMVLETEAFANHSASSSVDTSDGQPGNDSAPPVAVAAPQGSEARGESRTAVIEPILRRVGLTRSGWATRAGVDPSVVYDFLAGKSKPRPESRKVLAQALGIEELPD